MSGSILGVADSAYIDALFSSNVTNSQAQLDSLANTALSQGIDYYGKGSYDLAIKAFKRSAGLSPFSDNSAQAYDYMAKAYLKQNNTDQAIKTYKEAIRIYPARDTFHLALGDIYITKDSADEALAEYKAAVRLDPTSIKNRYSLGQSYLKAGQYNDARGQFQEVIRRSPIGASGYYGLGQVERAAGNYQDAILQLKKAITVDRTFENSYLELGYTYADLGDVQKVTEQLCILSAKGSSSTATLENYMSQVSQPQIISASSHNGFNAYLGSATYVADLDTELTAPGSTKLFSMDFIFSKEMDTASVLNRYNWTITRASITQNSGVYNGGLAVPETEANIFPIPVSVTYNDETDTATVQFLISQNAQGNATLDFKHIVFKFYGVDAYAKAMDTSADEYSGFSGIA
jgi:Tfp pilus assembly protein PilF